jgi:hypothetical protein
VLCTLNIKNISYENDIVSKNYLTKNEMKVRILNLKNDLYLEHIRPEMDMKGLAHKYLNRVLDILEEYRE